MEEIDTQVEEGLAHLEKIQEELEEIKERTTGTWRSFFTGAMQGAGAIVGSVAAVIVLGWALSIFGFIPGLGSIAHYIQNAVAQIRR